MFLGAALWGIEERLELPPPVVPPGRRASAAGGRRSPATSSRRPTASPPAATANELFGPAFVEHYAAARRAEAAACHRFVSAEERDRYLDHV